MCIILQVSHTHAKFGNDPDVRSAASSSEVSSRWSEAFVGKPGCGKHGGDLASKNMVISWAMGFNGDFMVSKAAFMGFNNV